MSSSPPTRIESHATGKSPASGYESPPGVFASDLYEDEYTDPVYQAKARILNHSIQEIGMGKYQACAFNLVQPP